MCLWTPAMQLLEIHTPSSEIRPVLAKMEDTYARRLLTSLVFAAWDLHLTLA